MAHLETTDDLNLPAFSNIEQAVGSTGSYFNPLDPSVHLEPKRVQETPGANAVSRWPVQEGDQP
jgi:hypothetical protein